MEIVPYTEEMRPAVLEFFQRLGWTVTADSHPDLWSIAATYELFLIGMEEGEVAVTAGVQRLDSTTVVLRRVYAARQFDGKGFSKRMVQCAKAYAKQAGYKKAWLSVRPESKTARGVYERLGFMKVDETLPLPYDIIPGTICMELTL